MIKYYPILVTKSGELNALDHLDPKVKSEIAPILEVLPGTLSALEAFLINNWSFKGNTILLDFSLFGDVLGAIADITTFFNNVFQKNVNAIPVVQRNSDALYLALVHAVVASGKPNVAYRFSNFSGGFLTMNTDIAWLDAQVGAVVANTNIIVDFGYAEFNTHATTAVLFVTLISGLANRTNFASIILAAGSFIENMTPLAVGLHHLRRYEWSLWNSINAITRDYTLKYADYGTKYPIFADAGFAGTISTKYTTENHFVIYRGVLTQDHPDGHGQYIHHSKALVASVDFSGAAFSWGDFQIDFISKELLTNPKKKPGSPHTWVTISQNHHITILHSLL